MIKKVLVSSMGSWIVNERRRRLVERWLGKNRGKIEEKKRKMREVEKREGKE